MESLTKKIKVLKSKLNGAIIKNNYNLTCFEVVIISREIDEHLNQYYRDQKW